MQLTGAEIVIRCLHEEGVEYVFGYPGGAVLNIYDEIFKPTSSSTSLFVTNRAQFADGYSRSSHGWRGAGDVGPRVTNAVTGIATAYVIRFRW